MRYISKQDVEPECLSTYKDECREIGVPEPLFYRDFNKTGQLKKILCQEQHNVCCYCQRTVKGFRIEHSYPENGPDRETSERLQLEYTNLFASCIDSQGFPPNLQYCDVAKGNSIMREFIKEPGCKSYFRYLSTGEIIPNGRFTTLKEYEESTDLTLDEKDAIEAIRTLNLNCPTLVSERKICLTELLSILPTRSKEEWAQIIEKWVSASTFPSYIELRLQYLQKYINT